jgi:hypothetical protein
MLALSIAAAVVVLAGAARGDSEPISIDYDAGPGCPGRDEFVARVLARTSRPQIVPSGEGAARGFVVRARAEDDGATGSVAALGDSAGNARELRSDDCDEIVSALALIVALAVDPSASTAATPRQPPPAPAPEPLPSAQPPEPPAPPPPQPRAERAPRRSGWFAQLYANTTVLIAESTVPILGAKAGVAWQGERFGAFAPAAALCVGAGESPTVHPAGGGAARFSLLSAAIDLSPVAFDLTRSVTLRPALGLEAGRLAASPEPEGAIAQVRPTAKRPWLALYEALRLQIDCGRGWLADVEAGAAQPLQSDTFEFHDPEITVLSVPRLAPAFAVGVSGRIW